MLRFCGALGAARFSRGFNPLFPLIQKFGVWLLSDATNLMHFASQTLSTFFGFFGRNTKLWTVQRCGGTVFLWSLGWFITDSSTEVSASQPLALIVHWSQFHFKWSCRMLHEEQSQLPKHCLDEDDKKSFGETDASARHSVYPRQACLVKLAHFVNEMISLTEHKWHAGTLKPNSLRWCLSAVNFSSLHQGSSKLWVSSTHD